MAVEYEITITRREPNPNYKPQSYQLYHDDRDAADRQQYIGHQVLSVTIDEPTFQAIRKAAIETL